MLNFYCRKDRMRYHFRKTAGSVERIADSKRKPNTIRYALNAKKAFGLIETVAALAILALVSSSVLVVINRCMASVANSAMRMKAFEVARENMETLLAKNSAAEMVEYGNSDKYPEIQWQTTVETFYEPITARMWIQAICSAEYTDTTNDTQSVEFTHWLTNLTKTQLLQIIEEKQKEKEQSAKQDEDEQDEQDEQSNQDQEDEQAKQDQQDKQEQENKQAKQDEQEQEDKQAKDKIEEPEVNCDALPYCEMFKCHLEAGTIDRLSDEELFRYIGECLN